MRKGKFNATRFPVPHAAKALMFICLWPSRGSHALGTRLQSIRASCVKALPIKEPCSWDKDNKPFFKPNRTVI